MEVSRIDYGGYTPPVENTPAPELQAGAYAPLQIVPSVVYEEGSSERRDTGDVLDRAVNEINSSLTTYRRHLSIRYHEPTNRRIVTVYDSDTNEKVREIPPETVLDAHANMLEMAGLFVNTKR
ncbi:MAG: flagellar protein FlaG [Defluviitaleaceae bacterium]|nr:flagellar protein FlaG [Defluviitaleaceae bacterium]